VRGRYLEDLRQLFIEGLYRVGVGGGERLTAAGLGRSHTCTQPSHLPRLERERAPADSSLDV